MLPSNLNVLCPRWRFSFMIFFQNLYCRAVRCLWVTISVSWHLILLILATLHNFTTDQIRVVMMWDWAVIIKMMHYPDSDTCHAPTTLLRKHPPFVKNQEINESERAASSSHSDDQGKSQFYSGRWIFFKNKNNKTFSQIKERRHPVANFYFYT